MNKAELMSRIQETTGMPREESYDVLENLLSIMKDALGSGENVRIKGFGNFEVREKKDRNGRNPQTGAAMTIKGRRVLTFKPSPIFKKEINGE